MANSERKEQEVKRVPLHQQRKLRDDFSRDGFVRKWVFDYEYQEHLLAGYAPVEDENIKTHDDQIQLESKAGSLHTRLFNVGHTAADNRRRCTLMEIPKDLYDEDCKPERDEISAWEAKIDESGEFKKKAFFGKVTIE